MSRFLKGGTLLLATALAGWAQTAKPRSTGPELPPPRISPIESGARLIHAFMYQQSADSIAPFLEDGVRASLTKENIQDFRNQISWLPNVLGDALTLFMSGQRPGPDGESIFFREYRFANEANEHLPLIVIQVLFVDSLTNKASGIFAKSFIGNNEEKRIAGSQVWKVSGEDVNVHSLFYVEFGDSVLLALSVYDAPAPTHLDSTLARTKAMPLIREAIARGWADSAMARQGENPKPLLNEIGVKFIRMDPELGYSHMKFSFPLEGRGESRTAPAAAAKPESPKKKTATKK